MRPHVAEGPRILSLVPGRMRVHLPGGTGGERQRLDILLRRLPGVESVQANPRTGNVLIHFDPRLTDAQRLLPALPRGPGPGHSRWGSALARVGVRGLIGHAVVDTLWFGAGFLGQSVGLPLAGLGPLHLLLDALVWGAALASGAEGPGLPRGVTTPRSPTC